jgi:hypothetical protein
VVVLELDILMDGNLELVKKINPNGEILQSRVKDAGVVSL